MIHTAHIGVGLYGVEGTEAASNSDYAITEFKNLRRLLFYHGTSISSKFTKYINLFMYKSCLFSVIPLYFAFFNGFSG
jgi:magnesium-transporting ATPase (P-type)